MSTVVTTLTCTCEMIETIRGGIFFNPHRDCNMHGWTYLAQRTRQLFWFGRDSSQAWINCGRLRCPPRCSEPSRHMSWLTQRADACY